MTREESILAGKGLWAHRTLDDVGVELDAAAGAGASDRFCAGGQIWLALAAVSPGQRPQRIDIVGERFSATIRPFSSSLHRRRRTTPVTSAWRRTICASSLMSTIMCTRSSIPTEPRSCTARSHSAMWGKSTANPAKSGFLGFNAIGRMLRYDAAVVGVRARTNPPRSHSRCRPRYFQRSDPLSASAGAVFYASAVTAMPFPQSRARTRTVLSTSYFQRDGCPRKPAKLGMRNTSSDGDLA